MNSNLSYIGSNVRQLRKARKWTQDEAARKAGISRIALIHIESGKAVPTIETLSALSGIYEVPLTSLLVRAAADRGESAEGAENTPGHDGLDAFEYELGQINRALKGCSLAEVLAIRKVVESIMSGFLERFRFEPK